MCSNVTDFQKRLIADSMRGLEYEEYLQFVKDYLNEKKSSDYVIQTLLVSYYSNKDYIIKNYKNPIIGGLLREIKKDFILNNDLISYIDEILIGKVWENKKEHYRQAFIQNKNPLPEGVELLPDSYEKYGGVPKKW